MTIFPRFLAIEIKQNQWVGINQTPENDDSRTIPGRLPDDRRTTAGRPEGYLGTTGA